MMLFLPLDSCNLQCNTIESEDHKSRMNILSDSRHSKLVRRIRRGGKHNTVSTGHYQLLPMHVSFIVLAVLSSSNQTAKVDFEQTKL